MPSLDTNHGGMLPRRLHRHRLGNQLGSGRRVEKQMSELTEDEAREPTLAYIAEVETRIGVLELALRDCRPAFSACCPVAR